VENQGLGSLVEIHKGRKVRMNGGNELKNTLTRLTARRMSLNIRTSRLLFLCFMLFAFVFNDKAYGDEKPVAFEEYVSEGGYFKVSLPSGWSKIEQTFGLSAEEKKVYGIDVLGPNSEDGIVSRVSVHYYAPGNLLHKTMETFITIHARPVLGVNLDGREYGQVKDDRVAGRPAKVFERKVYEYIPSDVFKRKKIAVYERFLVVPSNKGFYVLRYSAPEDIAEQYQGIFDKAISSFELLIQ
jgi:hypothetical protein